MIKIASDLREFDGLEQMQAILRGETVTILRRKLRHLASFTTCGSCSGFAIIDGPDR